MAAQQILSYCDSASSDKPYVQKQTSGLGRNEIQTCSFTTCGEEQEEQDKLSSLDKIFTSLSVFLLNI